MGLIIGGGGGGDSVDTTVTAALLKWVEFTQVKEMSLKALLSRQHILGFQLTGDSRAVISSHTNREPQTVATY